MLLALLLALPPPIVSGRVGEPSAGAAGARVTLVQGERSQVLSTGADGTFRFRAFPGAGQISVVLPKGWTADGPTSAQVVAQPGRTVSASFPARAQRVLHGWLLLDGAPIGDAEVEAAGVRAHADLTGKFVAAGVPAGRVPVRLHLASGFADLPGEPGEYARDVALSCARLSDLKLAAMPQQPFSRALQAWIEERPLTPAESADIERLAALANLNPAFRLVLVGRPEEAAKALQAALVLERYLIGPYLVPRERIAFAEGEVAPAGRLALVLMRPEGG